MQAYLLSNFLQIVQQLKEKYNMWTCVLMQHIVGYFLCKMIHSRKNFLSYWWSVKCQERHLFWAPWKLAMWILMSAWVKTHIWFLREKIYRVEQQTKTELNVFRYSRARWDFCGHFPLKCSRSLLPFKLSRICQGPGQASLWNFLS